MDIVASYSTLFPPDIRSRGEAYFRRGRVHLEENEPARARATVLGKEMYTTDLVLGDDGLRIHCTCPVFAGRPGPCKHIWATILAARDSALPAADGRAGATSRSARLERRREPDWRRQLSLLRSRLEDQDELAVEAWPAHREILYVVGVDDPLEPKLPIDLFTRDRKLNGDWGRLRTQRIPLNVLDQLASTEDGFILSTLSGSLRTEDAWIAGGHRSLQSAPHAYMLSGPVARSLLPRICATGRAHTQARGEAGAPALAPLTWETGEPWRLHLSVVPDDSDRYRFVPSFRRGEEAAPLDAFTFIHPSGIAIREGRAAEFAPPGHHPWVRLFSRHPDFRVPRAEAVDLLADLASMPRVPELDLPEELQLEEVHASPRPVLRVHPPRGDTRREPRLPADLSFDYEGVSVPAGRHGKAVLLRDARKWIVRNEATESAAEEKLLALGFRAKGPFERGWYELAPSRLTRSVGELVAQGWQVEADGRIYRAAGKITMEVNSGVDWFDLRGSVQFGSQVAHLPELLAAVKRGEHAVQLGDGTFGLLPEDWLQRYGLLAGLGSAEEESLRFSRSQVGLLDALLATRPEVKIDAVFAHARDELRRFDGVTAAEPPPGFRGELRGYQKEGLGWLHFLRDFGFGGCLADDMGLGKTVMVLALLENRRVERLRPGNDKRPGPSLVVVPRSLVWNWKAEAARFTPLLHVHDHTGPNRGNLLDVVGEEVEPPRPVRSGGRAARPLAPVLEAEAEPNEVDVIITTYGTLRRDAAQFKEVTFDYVILDEAQAVKNADTDASKAARLLSAHHRLALSGTPVENHLGELWSLFEFLNPGMLGAASVLKLGNGTARNPEPETRALLARALRPFILRRTKQQVVTDLPEKTEQTIFCEMEPRQRHQYDELREHYRRLILNKVAREGLARSKFEILEALLRLRQVACHPALVDPERAQDPSAKLDLLLPQLLEVIEEGHKALVFSQFTKFLGLLRNRLDEAGVQYAYLDGRTRDRAARVAQFQEDPDCRLFLVSLKAGGVGLNLTAAEYVFLLDPWWNPAVEAQAIDRAHRIGQTNAVFAYRLIVRGTVEEKILELQKYKRDLAEAIISEDNSLIRDLRREELELLLS